MKPLDLVLHCMTWKEDGQWLAVCLDFNLAAQDDSMEGAKDRLRQQVLSYLTEALAGEDQQHAAYLLRRRSPLRYWLSYYLSGLAHKLRMRVGTCEYRSPVPLIPA